MKTLRWNGEFWYIDKRSIFKRLRQWLIIIGGWERNGRWSLTYKYLKRTKLSSPTPISAMGHRFTYYGWGCELRLRTGWLVWSWREGRMYISINGTPSEAHHWVIGKPDEPISIKS